MLKVSRSWQGLCAEPWKISWSNSGFRVLVKNPESTQPLEDFWKQHQLHDEDEPTQNNSEVPSPSFDKSKRSQGQPSPNGLPRTRNRAISTASALAPSRQGVSSHHPALSLPSFLDTFGPLIFPLYKAALLRRRILLVGYAPVELTCNYGRASSCEVIL